MLALADRLKKSVREIEEMEVGEFREWLAWLQVHREKMDEARG